MKSVLELIENEVKEIIASLIKEIDPTIIQQKSFIEMGVNSILAVEVVESINQKFKIHLGIEVIFDYRGIRELSEFIFNEYGETFQASVDKNIISTNDTNHPVFFDDEAVLSNRTKPIDKKQSCVEHKLNMVEQDSDIAIIGISGKFADSDNIEEFWNHLQKGESCIREIIRNGWKENEYFDPDNARENKSISKWGGLIKNIDKFDPLFFNISPGEAERMDPQQRLFLEESFKAFEDSGYSEDNLSGKAIGVFVGGRASDYKERTLQEESINSQTFLGNDMSILAARISYFLNLKGPCLTVDTACSSSLVAIHLACESIHRGETEMALAGGVFIVSSPEFYIMTSKTEMLSSDGKCKTFDNSANGIVIGEGVGALVLKKLNVAIEDGDHIYGIIKGSKINQDGSTKGITAPSMLSQKELIYETYKNASINPETISYVEAHGTGTKLGDPIEIKALTEAFRVFTKKNQFCAIGSHKPNFGHAIMASGMAGIFKVLMAMKYKKIPPTISVNEVNEHINFKQSPFFVNKQLMEWKSNIGDPRRASISSFGLSGTNCHMIIEEAPVQKTTLENPKRPYYLLPFSAKNKNALKQKLVDICKWINNKDNKCTLDDISYTLFCCKNHYSVRCIFLVEDMKEFKQKIQEVIKNKTIENYFENIYDNSTMPNEFKESENYGVRILDELQANRYFDKGIYKEKLLMLSSLYVKGYNFSWKSLFNNGCHYRIPLPTYPFDEGRYWIQNKEMPKEVSTSIQLQNSNAINSVGNALMVPVWNVIQVNREDLYPTFTDTIIIIGGTQDIRDSIQQFYPNALIMQIQPSDNVDNIVKKFNEYDFVNHIVWVSPSSTSVSLIDEKLIENQNQGVIQIFRIIKALLQLGYGAKDIGWTVITLKTQTISTNSEIDPTHASIHGLIGSMTKEYPNWRVRLLDMDTNCNWPIEDIFTIPTDSLGNVLVYRNQEWYKQKLVPFYQNLKYDKESYKHGGVYVVIGGAGGIGEIWSEYVIRTYQANVIWVGRRNKDEKIQFKLDRLATLGPAPRYITADATNKEALQYAYEEIKNNYKYINGVIDSSIVLFDQSLENMDERHYKSVLSTKVDISVRIAQIFKEEQLDFVLFFSSIMSFTKAAGQSNYASGCTFKDAFAHQLSLEWHCAVKVINWGYWGTIGVVASTSYKKKMLQQGIDSIDPYVAMDTLEILLTEPLNQMVLLKTTRLLNWDIIDYSESITVYPQNPNLNNQSLQIYSQIYDTETKKIHSIRNVEMQNMNNILCKLLRCQLQRLGLFTEKNINIINREVKPKLLNLYNKWMESSLAILEENICDISDSTVLNIEDVWQLWNDKKVIWSKDSGLKSKTVLVESTLRALPEILTGQISATDIMFPNSSTRLVEGIYRNDIVADYFNTVLVNTLITHIQEQLKNNPSAEFRIIEIGAGTGGTTTRILQQLKPYNEHIKEYCYTDISKTFLIQAKEKFDSQNSYLIYKLFDIEKPIDTQGITANRYDIVIAANILHATKNIRQTLRNTKAVLKNKGLLLLNEINSKNLFNHLTFGLLQGWWLYEDKLLRIPGCPALCPKAWKQVLDEEGFFSISFPSQSAHELGQQIIVAQSNGVIRKTHKSEVPLLSAKKNTNIDTRALGQDKKNLNAIDSSEKNMTGKISLDYIKETIKEKLSESLKIDVEMINDDCSFADYGLDSISGIHLVQVVNKTLVVELKTIDIFDYSSVNELAKYILSRYRGIIANTLEHNIKQTDITTNAEAYLINQSLKKHMDYTSDNKELSTINNIQEQEITENSLSKEPIAIIGMSGRFADSNTVDDLWKHLINMDDLVKEVTRWDMSKFHSEIKKCGIYGGFLDDIDKFDPLFFNISGLEASYMDPQQRLFLEESWKALEDAGYAGIGIDGHSCGVYAGYNGCDYQQLIGEHPPAQAMWGNAGSLISARISYYLNLQGPAITIDTACSSSLVAIHLACQSLRMKETELALAGGVFLQSTPEYFLKGNRAGMLSTTGRCYTFDERADGFVWGEGVGAVVLKRFSEAVADGDHIYGIIKGSAINQDGTTNGITAPSSKSQERLEQHVYDTFNINPEEIQMVEAHGTGTKLGDPIEYGALTHSFRNYTDKKNYCAIGSIKTNIGHTSAASGVAGLIKILLSLKHKQIPPSLHFKSGNPNIEFNDSPFYVNTSLNNWTVENGSKRCAAISAFGFSGTNAHMVIQESPNMKRSHPEKPGYLIVLSARTHDQLRWQAKQMIEFCEQNPTIDCGNMSYTLLMGRKHLGYRLACMVHSQKDLDNKLKKWIDTGKALQTYASGVTEIKYHEQLLLKKFGNQCIKMCQTIDNNEEYINHLLTIGDLYVQGYVLDFNQLFIKEQYSRISLPTYPFIKERYWIPETGSKYVCDSNTPGLSMHTIHPLLHKNISNLSEQRYSSTFIGKEFFLSDHVIKGQKTFPGVAYLEMVRAAIEQATGMEKDDWGKVHLKNVVWIKPITVDDRPVRVDISLFPEDNGEITYEVYGEPFESDMDAVVHCQGSVILSDNGEAPILNVEELQKQCSQRTISSNQCYGMFKEVGINYGLGHQGIKEIYVGQDQVLAKLYLPSSVNSTKDNYVLHPSIMDSALQASACLMLNFNKNKLILPFALQELTIFNKCTSSMWAFIRNSKDNKTDDKVQKLDIDLCDNQGKVCVTMRNVSFRILESKTSMTEMITDTETLIFRPVWKDQAIVKKDKPLKYTNHIVILCGGGTELKDTIETCIEGVLCISLELRKESRGEQFQIYTLQIFDKIQKIIKDKPKGNILIQVMVFSQAEQNLFAGLSGLLRTAKLENSKLIGQLIEIEAVEDRKNIIKILLENSHCPMNDQIRYKDNKRYISTWNEIKTSEDTSPLTKTWKDGGVYLITGGTGGLGLIFAREIAEKTQGCTLILVGRSPIDEDKQAQLKELKKLGATVDYKQTDISKKEDVYKLIKGIREERGIINGIIHSAGIIEDNFIIKKTKEEIVRVMSPKVLGLVNLDESTREFKLDFFILFSSIAGVIGNVGQADYSAANAFMDVYARYRNALVTEGQCYGHTLSINWPMWKEGGMHINKESEKMMIHNMGIIAMKTQSGINAFNQTLTLETDQVMVIEGDRQKVKQKLLSIIEPKVSTLEEVSGKSNTYIEIDKENLLNKIQGILKHIVSQILKVKIEDLYTDNELSEYGFDSITLTEFANRINHSYKLDLTPTIFFEYPTLHDFAEYLVREQASSFDTGFITQCKEKPLVISQKNENRDKKDIFNKRQHYRFAKGVMSSQANLENTISDDPIAIIGMSGVFPMANDVEELWGNLVDGRDCITEIPKDRWDWTKYYGDPIKEINKTNIKWGGFIDGIGDFDPLFFGISPREAVLMDPQQRLLMIYAWKVIEDAGYSAKSISGTNTGIFVGTGSSGYNGLIEKANIAIEGYSATGVVPSIGPNRMSYLLNIHGPSEPIETACSSSLVAIHHAVSAIKSGNCDMAIVGGVNSIVTPEAHISFSKAGMLCEDGRCKTFSDKANGYVRGEGAGMLFLKKLKAAEKDGDHIYGLLRGSSENHGGRANSLTAPNPKAQVELLKSAYYKAGIDPRTVTYIETHGTGTELGDPIEINGLKTAFKELYQTTRCPQIENSYCGLGSIKTNIGHLELAAGIAGVIKVLLQMKHKTLVKNLHCDTINPYIELKDSPFYIVTENKEWKPVKDDLGNKLPLRAGISAFGFGGVNAHVVIEEYVPQVQNHPQVSVTSQNPAIIVLSAKNEDRLKVKAQNLLEAIQKQKFSDTDLDKIAYTLQVGREAMEERLGFTAESIKKLEEKLKWFLENKSTNEDLFRGQCNHNREELAFLSTDEEMQEALGKWIQRKKYAKLLELWVKGVNLDWNKLYGENKPHRISLPSYPFTKERYWVSKTKEKIGITASRVPPNKEQSAPYRTCEKPKGISLVPLSENHNITYKNQKIIKQEGLESLSYSIDEVMQKVLDNTLDIEQADQILHKYVSIRSAENKNKILPDVLLLQKEITASLAKVLNMKHDDIDIYDKFIDLGLDSITGVEWIQNINKKYSISIKVTRVYDYPNIQEFTNYLIKEISGKEENS
ncbi:SDR family NAD(P)-dependent oxidoreductase [Clostridium estertheticum]|uniref:SDR family NAD(P)-dependent oxidoreductase n=1 Tax=Clostridium estertheticum TaxID=238834 RepID=UPI001CCD4C6E|nr:SDR family NAD(P)-dependent oxidoreductase [Clostridium estertheticum]MBZ9609907.1 SDR family NAD(P)-dependent oxidoreductase [Clostridium estertheticum]